MGLRSWVHRLLLRATDISPAKEMPQRRREDLSPGEQVQAAAFDGLDRQLSGGMARPWRGGAAYWWRVGRRAPTPLSRPQEQALRQDLEAADQDR